MHNLFRMSSQASLDAVYGKFPRLDRELLQTYSGGLIGTTGCVSGEVQTRLRQGQYDKALEAAADLRDIFGRGQLLRRGDGPRPRDRAPHPRGPPADRQGPRPAARGHQRPALHPGRGRHGARGAAVRAVRLHPGRPRPVQVRRRRVLPQEPGADARGLARPARGVRQHPADRRAVRGHLHRGRGALHAPVRVPRGRGRALLVHQGGRPRPGGALPRRRPRRRPRPGRLRDRGHRLQGLRRLLPRRGRLHQLGQGERHPGRSRPRLRRRARCARTRCGSPTSTRCSTA